MSTSDTRTAPEAGPTPGVRRRIPREAGLGVVLVVLVVSFATFTPRFATGDTFAQIGTDLAIVLIVAVGQALVLFTHNIDVSVGSTVGLRLGSAVGVVVGSTNSVGATVGPSVGDTLGSPVGVTIAPKIEFFQPY